MKRKAATNERQNSPSRGSKKIVITFESSSDEEDDRGGESIDGGGKARATVAVTEEGKAKPGKAAASELKATARKLTPIQQAHADKLMGSRFRYLNEELYTTPSSASFSRFQSNPDLFEVYHKGFREQARNWMGGQGNPVHWIIALIRKAASRHDASAAKAKITVADFGCGDALIARSLCKDGSLGPSTFSGADEKASGRKRKKKGKAKAKGGLDFDVHSLDMVSPPPPSPLSFIKACNIASVPFIATESVDIGVYSLALMGVDVFNILKEGSRVVKVGGILLIAEVRSR